jgi:cytochrome c5
MQIGIRAFIASVASVACVLLPLISVAVATEPNAQDAAEIQDLQKQVDALTSELAKVQTGTNSQARKRAMQSHWSMMQNYLQSMRQWPGMNPKGASDWVLMSPAMMGGGTMGWYHGTGPGNSWAVPNDTPAQYEEHMQALQQRMRNQAAAISAENDPTIRDALIRQHYYTIYRDMQTMRGLDWMWDQGTASALPDASSHGAALETKYCSQCHAAPAPSARTVKEWADVTLRMQQHITDKSTSNGGVMVPSSSEMASIIDYLDKHAKPGT